MSRRAQFCEPVQSEQLVVGIDVAKRKMVARAVTGDGRSGKACRFGCDADGFGQLIQYAEGAAERFGAKGWVAAMEPTGHYGEPLAEWLLQRGVKVYAVQPLKTRRAKELYDGTWRKTDDKDALVIADLCRRGLGKPWRVLGGPFAKLRVLSRRRQQLVGWRRRLCNRLHRHRDVVFPELGGLFPKLQSTTSRWVLRHAATPEAVLQMSGGRLAGHLRRVSRGQLGQERAEAMVRAASKSIGVVITAEVHWLAIGQLLDELEEVLRQLAEVERWMEAELPQVPYAAHLLSVPGFGPVTVATLLGEFGDLRHYRVAKQLIKMAGLDLAEDSSGERQGHHHISRRGRSYARQMLYMAALTAGRGALSTRRRRLVQKGKSSRVAVVANACALLRISHALVRDGVDFEPAQHTAPQQQMMAA